MDVVNEGKGGRMERLILLGVGEGMEGGRKKGSWLVVV